MTRKDDPIPEPPDPPVTSPSPAKTEPEDPPTTKGTAAPSHRLLKIGSAVAGLGVLAEIAGHITKIQTTVVGLVGLRASRDLHLIMTVFVTLVIVGGIAVAAYWFLQNHRWSSAGRRRAFAAATGVVILAVAGAAYALGPKAPEPRAYVAIAAERWAERLLHGFGLSGGTLVSFQDPEGPTQVWTTAQALKALLAAPALPAEEDNVRGKLWNALEYIHRARIGDRGGWGYFDAWPTAVTEIAGWVGVAYAEALHRRHDTVWSESQQREIRRRTADLVHLLVDTQQPDGGWGPTPQRSTGGSTRSRTYSTVMAVWALIEAQHAAVDTDVAHAAAVGRGLLWLSNNYDRELGWVPNPTRKAQNETFLGLNAQVLYVVSRAQRQPAFAKQVTSLSKFSTAKEQFLANLEFESKPIGDNARLHDTDRYVHDSAPHDQPGACSCPFTVEGSTFLWLPWSLAAASELARDPLLNDDQRDRAGATAETLAGRLNESTRLIDTGLHYIIAEFLFGSAVYLKED